MISLSIISNNKEVIDIIYQIKTIDFEIKRMNQRGILSEKKSLINYSDILVLDICLFKNHALNTIIKYKQYNKSLKILVISGPSKEEEIRKYFRAGIDGYLLDGNEYHIEAALHTIISGEYYFSDELVSIVMSGLTKSVHSRSEMVSLTKREKEVLNLIVEGFTSKQIANKLYIAESTADTHRKNIVTKTGVSNSKALSKYAYEHGLLIY